MKHNRWIKYGWEMAAVLLLFASCSRDGLPGDGDTLPEGKYPLALTAEMDGMKTRAAGKDAWTDGDEIGVRIGADGAAGRYKLNADGAEKEAVTPVYWQNTASATVKAWYPYVEKKGDDIYNQSNGYANYDFLTATAENQNYRTPVALNFKHQMAKVKYILQAGNGITDAELAKASVQIYGYNRVSFSQGTLTPYSTYNSWITPFKTSDTEGEALLVPQNMAGKQFIKVTINSQKFYYTPKAEENVGNLVAGNAYTYTITVSAYGIEVEAVAGGTWSDGGSEAAGILVAEYTAGQEKYGDYIYDDGTTSDGGLRARYSNGSMKWANPKPASTPGKTLLGNLVAKYTANDVKPGDYIYDDGTTSDGGLRFRLTDGTLIRESLKPMPQTSKTVSGIVFWTPSETDYTDTDRKTPARLTDDKIMTAAFPECTKGLAVALKDVPLTWQGSVMDYACESVAETFQNTAHFAPENKQDFCSIASGTGETDDINRILGYQNTQVLIAYNLYKTSTDYHVNPIAKLASFKESNPAPEVSTGWFLPSVKELHILCYGDVDNVGGVSAAGMMGIRDMVNSSLSAAKGTELVGNNIFYWSSTETDGSEGLHAFGMNFGTAGVGYRYKFMYGNMARYICAF